MNSVDGHTPLIGSYFHCLDICRRVDCLSSLSLYFYLYGGSV